MGGSRHRLGAVVPYLPFHTVELSSCQCQDGVRRVEALANALLTTAVDSECQLGTCPIASSELSLVGGR